MPLDRVWFFGLAVLNRVYNLTWLCPKEGQNLVLNRAWYYEPRDFNPDCKKSLSFPIVREVRLKEHAIKRRTTSGASLFLICLISTELNRQLPGHYNVIHQHQIIFWTRMLLLSVSFNFFYFSTYRKQARIDRTDRTGWSSFSVLGNVMKEFSLLF